MKNKIFLISFQDILQEVENCYSLALKYSSKNKNKKEGYIRALSSRAKGLLTFYAKLATKQGDSVEFAKVTKSMEQYFNLFSDLIYKT